MMCARVSMRFAALCLFQISWLITVTTASSAEVLPSEVVPQTPATVDHHPNLTQIEQILQRNKTAQMDPCSLKPCVTGKCMHVHPNEMKRGFVCKCPKCHTGILCQEKVEWCDLESVYLQRRHNFERVYERHHLLIACTNMLLVVAGAFLLALSIICCIQGYSGMDRRTRSQKTVGAKKVAAPTVARKHESKPRKNESKQKPAPKK